MLVNCVLNFTFIPYFGINGAVYSTFSSYLLLLLIYGFNTDGRLKFMFYSLVMVVIVLFSYSLFLSQ